MDNMKILNPNFFFLKDSYPELYEKCKMMDLAIIEEKYTKSVIITKDILQMLLQIVLKSDDDDLDKLIDKICKLNSTASEIGLYIKEIRMNSLKAIKNSRRFSKNKAIKNAELVYEVTSYFLYQGVNPLDTYNVPQYYDDWVKKEIADIRALEEYEVNINAEIDETKLKSDDNTQKALDDFTSNSNLKSYDNRNLKEKQDKSDSKSKKVVIKVKTEKTPVIRIIMREDMIDKFKPVIDIDYIDD